MLHPRGHAPPFVTEGIVTQLLVGCLLHARFWGDYCELNTAVTHRHPSLPTWFIMTNVQSKFGHAPAAPRVSSVTRGQSCLSEGTFELRYYNEKSQDPEGQCWGRESLTSLDYSCVPQPSCGLCIPTPTCNLLDLSLPHLLWQFNVPSSF